MSEYDKTNTFVLFINDREGPENKPDRTGSLNVDGVEYFIDGWIKDGSKGKFLAGRIKRKTPAREQAPRGRQEAEDDREIPF